MKYLILRRREEPEVPVLFAGHVSHADMAEIFRADGFAVLSAGFVKFHPHGAVTTHDRSVSLNLSPRPGDSMFIAAFYRITLASIGVPLVEPGRWHISDPDDDDPRVVETPPATSCQFCPGPAEPIAGTHCPDCPVGQG